MNSECKKFLLCLIVLVLQTNKMIESRCTQLNTSTKSTTLTTTTENLLDYGCAQYGRVTFDFINSNAQLVSNYIIETRNFNALCCEKCKNDTSCSVFEYKINMDKKSECTLYSLSSDVLSDFKYKNFMRKSNDTNNYIGFSFTY